MEYNTRIEDFFREGGEFGGPGAEDRTINNLKGIKITENIDEKLSPYVQLAAALVDQCDLSEEDRQDLMQDVMEFILGEAANGREVSEVAVRDYINDRVLNREEADMDGMDDEMLAFSEEDLFHAVVAARLAVEDLMRRCMLTPRQAETFQIKHGLKDGIARSNRDVAEEMGIAPSVVSDHYKRALGVIQKSVGGQEKPKGHFEQLALNLLTQIEEGLIAYGETVDVVTAVRESGRPDVKCFESEFMADVNSIYAALAHRMSILGELLDKRPALREEFLGRLQKAKDFVNSVEI
ncbi:hypothetical protein KKC94_04910 [Patescibacteria group bacterium]|nr:hypothetical protein [Patescibacteria group bacterium]